MSLNSLERRNDTRTPAYVPILLKNQRLESHKPAHLVDISGGGAGVMTTSKNAPRMGDYLELEFETPTNDGASESRPRKESAVVVHLGDSHQGVRRVGLRFLNRPDVPCDIFNPDDELDGFTYDPSTSFMLPEDDRWGLPASCDRDRVPLSAF